MFPHFALYYIEYFSFPFKSYYCQESAENTFFQFLTCLYSLSCVFGEMEVLSFNGVAFVYYLLPSVYFLSPIY